MLKEYRFFIWTGEHINLPIKLGDNIQQLLDSEIIIDTKQDSPWYKLSSNHDVWIKSKNNEVNAIYYTQNSGDFILGFDPFDFDYPATERINQTLSQRFERLRFNTIDQVKEHFSGDLLYVIFRDSNPSSIMLMRID